MILENYGWLCSCGESFAEPETLQSHMARIRQSGGVATDHKPLGYCDLDTHEQALVWNFKVWKGKWRGQLDKKYEAGTLPSTAKVVADDPGRTAEDGEPLGIPEDERDGKAEAKGSRKGKQSSTGNLVKIQFRPQVFDLEESVIHLYNLFLGSMRQARIPYEPSVGAGICSRAVAARLRPPWPPGPWRTSYPPMTPPSRLPSTASIHGPSL